MKPRESISNETKSEKIYQRLKASILNGEILSGKKLVISQLASYFNTSIIPVREALSRLEAESLVNIIPHTGVYAKGIDLTLLREIYPLRGVVEGFATRLSVGQLSSTDLEVLHNLMEQMDHAAATESYELMGELNIEFHKKIYSACGNDTLIKLINDLWEKTFFARFVFTVDPSRAKKSNEEHRMLFESLKNRNTQQCPVKKLHRGHP